MEPSSDGRMGQSRIPGSSAIAFIAEFSSAVAFVLVAMAFGLLTGGIRGRGLHHTLTRPRVVHSSGGVGILPAGTDLRHRTPIQEGGDYYEIVVLAHEDLGTSERLDPTLVSPIELASSHFRLSPDELADVLRSLGATRSDAEQAAERLAR